MEINLKTKWDYSKLAEAYLSRPQYSSPAINAIFSIAKLNSDDVSCDVGAGVGHLTTHFLQNGLKVIAVEPNDNMRALGKKNTSGKCEWIEGTGENTNQSSSSFKLVTFGSSFNVCERLDALRETNRILKSDGWFACMWNHRDLGDSIQSRIESIIKLHVPNYGYGTRREDQTEIIQESSLFQEVIALSSSINQSQTIADCIKAWESHATLERQAGNKFKEIINDIRKFLSVEVSNDPNFIISVPYTTRIWMAQKRN
jgi:ubiquinone/menaquinone biosynthesis C-methylase UbiE